MGGGARPAQAWTPPPLAPSLPTLGPHHPWPAPSVSLSAPGTKVSRSGVVVCVGHGHQRSRWECHGPGVLLVGPVSGL